MYGYIYKTTNLVNGKIYIGQHHSSVFEPEKYIGSGCLINKAIKKYGFEKFKCELIEECNSKEDLNKAEIKWINYYKTLNVDSYNLGDGGEGGIGRNATSYWNNPLKKKEALEKQSLSLKLFFKNHPEAHKGEKNPNFGKKASEETKRKMSEARKNSPGVKNASRFKGHQHTKEAKEKIRIKAASKIWITNDREETMIFKQTVIPEGWHKGRIDRKGKLTKHEY